MRFSTGSGKRHPIFRNFQSPAAGRRPCRVEGSLRLGVGDYVLDYDLIGNTVAITAIRHGRQLDPEFVEENDLDGEQ